MLLLPPANFLLLFDEHLKIKLYRCVIVLLILASEGERCSACPKTNICVRADESGGDTAARHSCLELNEKTLRDKGNSSFRVEAGSSAIALITDAPPGSSLLLLPQQCVQGVNCRTLQSHQHSIPAG